MAPKADLHLTDAERDLVAANAALVSLVLRVPCLQSLAEQIDSEDDAKQVAAVGLMRAAQLFDPARGQFSTFAVPHMRCALSRAVTFANRQCRKPPGEMLALDPARGVAAPEPAADESPARSVWLDDQLRTLPPTQRKVIELARQGLTMDEIGRAIGRSRQRAHQVYQRGVARLRLRARQAKHAA